MASLQPRLQRHTDAEGHSAVLEPWRRWFSTARWKALRWATLLRDKFTCQRCHHLEPDTSLLVADHKTPHRGDPALFWDPDNLECLCKRCHDGEKQAEERAAAGRGDGRG